MQSLLTVELLFITLIFFFGKGQSLKCYECRSDTDKGCSSSMNISLSKECPTKANASKVFCRKIHQQLKFKNEKGWTSIRECAYEKGPSACYRFKWLQIAHQIICECDNENCNRGGSHVQGILTVAVVFSLTWILNYLNTNSS